MKINTGIKATPKFMDILGSVIGQMSDGIWENSRAMEKYWKSLDYGTDENNCIILEDKYHVCADVQEFFAKKIKQIIKIEIDDGNDLLVWQRSCGQVPNYMHGHVTVGDCYELYELLKGRNTSKNKYASYNSYNVTMTYNGVELNIKVSAQSPRLAKEIAIKKLSEIAEFTCTIAE